MVSTPNFLQQCKCLRHSRRPFRPPLLNKTGYAPEKYEYPINRYAMETKRIFDVADQRLAHSRYLAGDEYTIADIANFPWLAPFTTGDIYNDAKTFLSIDDYTHVKRWVDEIAARPAVQRGRIVNKTWGDEQTQLRERHCATDFLGKRLG